MQNLKLLHGYDSNFINRANKVRVHVYFNFEHNDQPTGESTEINQILEEMNEKLSDLKDFGTPVKFNFT